MNRFPKKLDNLYSKTFSTDWIFKGLSKKKIASFFLWILHFLDYLDGLQKSGNFEERLKSQFKRYPKNPCFNLRTSWTDCIFLLILKFEILDGMTQISATLYVREYYWMCEALQLSTG